MGRRTSSGWAYKTNFKEEGGDPIEAAVRIEIARFFARLLMEHAIKDYSQWFPGDENNVSDALSRDYDRKDDELTHILYSCVPEQMPESFKIVPLPNLISSG